MHLQLQLPPHAQSLTIAVATVASLIAAVYLLRRPEASPADREQQRRLSLAAHGRIVDGILLEAHPSEHRAEIVVYTYRVAGVTYQCAQDVSALAPLNLRLDAPIQVRYSPRNPGNSITLAETWKGLW